jgi:membrane-bound serine protease (ClpP class)
MEFLINQNLAYILLIAAVMLTITTFLFPSSILPKIGMVLCLGAAGFEFFKLQANAWALLMIALSPFPYFVATGQSSQRRQLLIITVAMLFFGSAFLFVDENGSPSINMGLLFIVSIIYALFILVVTEGKLNARDSGRGINPDSYIGLIGKAITNIDDVGLVQIEGETCSACSDQPILAGSPVRILKYKGRVLVVKKVEKLSGK